MWENLRKCAIDIPTGGRLTRYFNRPISEHFIWYFLSQMVEALSAPQSGTCKDSHADEPLTQKRKRPDELDADTEVDAKEEPWKPLIHCDLKSSNVFCASGNEKYPLWPRVVMANFDLVQPADDKKERYIGTRGWQPPVSCEPGH